MNEALHNLYSRRSIRAFLSDPVPQETLEQLLEAALYAPSAMNTQPWHISVIRTQATVDWMVERIRTVLLRSGEPALIERARDPEFHTFYHAPVVLYISAEASQKFGVSDCANLTTCLTLAAHALGLGSCYIASSNLMFEGSDAVQARRRLRIPDGYEPVFSVALGYAAFPSPEPQPRREGTVVYVD